MRGAHRHCIEPASRWRPARGPRTKACPRLISDQGDGDSKTAQTDPKIKHVSRRPMPRAKNQLTRTEPLPKPDHRQATYLNWKKR